MTNRGGVGLRVEIARKKAGISKAALARIAGVAWPTVNNWARGIHDPDIISIRAIAKELNIPVNWFYEEEEDSEDLNINYQKKYIPLNEHPFLSALREKNIYESWLLDAANTHVQARDGEIDNQTLIKFLEEWKEAGEEEWKEAISKIGPPKLKKA